MCFPLCWYLLLTHTTLHCIGLNQSKYFTYISLNICQSSNSNYLTYSFLKFLHLHYLRLQLSLQYVEIYYCIFLWIDLILSSEAANDLSHLFNFLLFIFKFYHRKLASGIVLFWYNMTHWIQCLQICSTNYGYYCWQCLLSF